MDRPVDISDSVFTGTVSFRGASLPYGIAAARTIIEGSLLLGEKDDSDYEWDRSPGGKSILFLKAPHLRVRGDLVIAAASFSTTIEVSNANIDGTLSILYTVVPYIDLSASSTNGQSIIFRSAITAVDPGPGSLLHYSLNMFSYRSQQSILIDRSVLSGGLHLADAKVTGSLNLLGTSLGFANLSGSQFSGSLLVGENHPEGHTSMWTTWSSPSYADFSNAQFGSVRSPEQLRVWPLHIYLRGFSFTDFLSDWCGNRDCGHSVTWYKEWLGRQADVPMRFEPYENVTQILVKAGEFQEVNDLAFEGRKLQVEQALTRHNWWFVVFGKAYQYTVGFGFRIWYALIWALVLVIVGSLIFRRTSASTKYNMPYGIVYSIDMLLP
jgi:hypothetical protein